MAAITSRSTDTRPLLCFQHCKKQTNIVCFRVPELCPLCHQSTLTTESRIPPFCLSSPFTTSKKSPCSIAIKPTIGTFIRNYVNSANFHVGVTDSSGVLLDFDEDGLHGDSVWNECLSISLLEKSGLDSQQWDRKLYQFANYNVWSAYRYHEAHNNCFDFVLSFLHSLNMHRVFPEFRDKQTFIQHFLLKRTTKAAQFISMYRQVEQFGFVCQRADS